MDLTLYIFLLLVSACIAVDLNAPFVQTPSGKLIGNYEISRNENQFEAYWGIRYGHVARRFEPSTPSGSWDGIKYAQKPAAPCAQISLAKEKSSTGLEDCLYLNIFTPQSDNGKRAVLVYIHGGGYVVGSTLEYGGKYLIDEDLVVVTVAYRLGILGLPIYTGFLNTQDGATTGNNGLRDQILALKWVQNNIEFFGGDKNRVTISGNSAGSSSVLQLLLSPMSQGLFHGVYGQSGAPLSKWAYQETIRPIIHDISKYVHCDTTNSKEMVECLRKTSVDSLMLAQRSTARWAFEIFRTPPSLERRMSDDEELFMDQSPENAMREAKFQKMPLLFTVVKDEGSLNFGSIIIRDEALLKTLNTKASTLDPILFGFEEYKDLNCRQKISRQMREFYFGGQVIQKEHEQELVDLFSDTMFLRDIEKTAKLLGKHIPVYLGLFTYKRNDDFSPVSGLGVTDRVETVSHCEELAFLFNPTGEPNPLPYIAPFQNLRDIKFSEDFVKMVASFVKTGAPHIHFGDKPNWSPVSQAEIDADYLNYLNLATTPYLHTDPFKNRNKFWNSIPQICPNSAKSEL